MKFKTKDEFEAWLRDYSHSIITPYTTDRVHPLTVFGQQKTFKDEILSKDYTISDADTFVMDGDIVYIINRVNDPKYYYICYTEGKESNIMWWTMISNLYQRDIDIKKFRWWEWNGWPNMMGAKIWIIDGASKFESFINWNDNPFEVKS